MAKTTLKKQIPKATKHKSPFNVSSARISSLEKKVLALEKKVKELEERL